MHKISILSYETNPISSRAKALGFYNTFGSLKNGRNFCLGSGYRFGMNTQQKDDEIFVGAYTAEFWEYDSRLGRRWNLDPVTDFSLSSYQCFNNNPILFSDLFGDDIIIKGSSSYKKKVTKALGKISRSEEGLKILNELKKPGKIYEISKGDEPLFTPTSNGGKISFWGESDFESLSKFLHELGHAYDDKNGILSSLKGNVWFTPDLPNNILTYKFKNGKSEIFELNNKIDESEASAMDKENRFRSQMGYPLRKYYGSKLIEQYETLDDGRKLLMVRIEVKIWKVVDKNNIGTHPNFQTNYSTIEKNHARGGNGNFKRGLAFLKKN